MRVNNLMHKFMLISGIDLADRLLRIRHNLNNKIPDRIDYSMYGYIKTRTYGIVRSRIIGIFGCSGRLHDVLNEEYTK